MPIENGVYSCEYSFESQTSSDCSHLNNFIFNTNDGMFSWTPDYSQSGIYNVVISSPTGKKNKFLIEVAKKNAAPEISVVSSPAQYLENSSYQIELDALDANHDSLSYSYECLSANCHQIRNISLNQSTKIFSFDTDYNSEGSYSILFRVNDGQLSDSINVTFNVLNVNRAPVVSTINAVTISENQSWFTNIMGILNNLRGPVGQ